MQEKQLRSGYTTGTCGAAAAKAAAVCLLSGEIPHTIEIMTPKGIKADLAVEQVVREDGVFFRVQKDAGDDPDVTHQAYVYASVEPAEGEVEDIWYSWDGDGSPGLYLTGGTGIGMVTKPGLACPVGKHAINPVPRKMIFEAVESVCRAWGCHTSLLIRIEIPEGAELAAKTFNPRLGIEGGISVLGTSGIVEPMSEQALLAAIGLEIHMKAVEGCGTLILSPGNYGETFLKEELHLSVDRAVKCSNFIGDVMEILEKEGIKETLLVGHIGKLIKVAGGVRNTHSRYGDRRMEILAACAGTAGDGRRGEVSRSAAKLDERIRQSNTTEEALAYLQQAGILDFVMSEVTDRIMEHLNQWCHGKVRIEVVTFSLGYGILGKSRGADALVKRLTMEDT